MHASEITRKNELTPNSVHEWDNLKTIMVNSFHHPPIILNLSGLNEKGSSATKKYIILEPGQIA